MTVPHADADLFQQLRRMRDEVSRFTMEYRFAVDELLTKVSILREEFLHLHKYNPIEHVNSRIKQPDSIMAKANARGCEKSLASIREHVTDIAGVRITCSFIDDTYRVLEAITGQDDVRVLAVKDYIANKLIPWINPGSGARVLTSPVNAYVFSTFPSYVTEGRVLAKYALDNLPATKYGLLYQDDAFGREGQEGLRLGLRNTPKEITVAQTYKVGDSDLSAAAQKFKDDGVDLIFVWTIAEGAASLVKAIGAIEGYKPQLVASQILSDPVMFDLAGEGWEGAIVASSVPEPDSGEPGAVRAKQIIEKYGQGIQYGTYSLWGLSRAEVLVEGLKRSGRELTRLRLLQSLESVQNWNDNFLGHPISFDAENHLGLNAVKISRAEGGKLVHVSDWMEP